MDDFEREVGEAFSEVAEEGMPVAFTLNNDPHSGVVSSPVQDTHLREPGFEDVGQIVVMCPVVQFARPADEYIRQILQIETGPYSGKYVVQGANNDLAHYSLTCVPAD